MIQKTQKTVVATLLAVFLAITSNNMNAIGSEAGASQPTIPTTLSTKEVYNELLHGTVWVTTADGGHGTGWILDKEQGLIVTNEHVIRDAVGVGIYAPKFVNGKLATNSEDYTQYSRPIAARIVDSSRRLDLAVLQVASLPDHMHQLRIANESASAADQIHAIGAKAKGNQGAFVYCNGNVRQVSRGMNANFLNAKSLKRPFPSTLATAVVHS